LLFATVTCAVGIALPSSAAAQERKGFWASFGIGAGSIGLSAEDAVAQPRPFQVGRDSGGVAEVGLGWAVNQRLLVGIEVKTMVATYVGDVRGTLGVSNVSGVATYYLRSSSNLFVKGGVGGSFLGLTVDAPDPNVAVKGGTGFGFSAGAGYDVYLGHGFSLTPAVGFWYGRPGNLRISGQTLLRDWKHNVVDVTLSIKFN